MSIHSPYVIIMETTSSRGDSLLRRRHTYEKTVSNVHYINGIVQLGPVKLNVCAFSVDGVLIDTGSASIFPTFKPFLDAADVDQVVLTHHHEDHTGGAAYVQYERQLPIFMHHGKIASCKQRANYPLYRKLFWGVRRPFHAQPLGATFQSRTATWQVIETPGHASDHVSFINEKTGQLFSGDLYVYPKTRLILRNESIPQIIQSIETLLTYDFNEMFCCHAGYIKDGRKALQTKLDYLTELTERVYELAEKGLSEQEINRSIFPKIFPIIYFSFGEWHSKHIIRSILSEK